MRQFALALLVLLPLQAHGRTSVCVNGRCIANVRLPQIRAGHLREAANHLDRAQIPGYGVLYRTDNRRLEGAMVVAAVNPGDQGMMARWKQGVGSKSIGFLTTHEPNGRGHIGSGYVRVGNTFMDWSWIEGSGAHRGTRATDDIASHGRGYTEATFMTNEATLKAMTAFFHARANDQIRTPSDAKLGTKTLPGMRGRDNAIKPMWDDQAFGKTLSNIEGEACAGAASSVLNPMWVKHFEWNLKNRLGEIREYGRLNNIPELANVQPDAARQIKGFMRTYFGSASNNKQSNEPNSVVKKNAPYASMVTTFNGYDNPRQQLSWNLSAFKYTSGRSGKHYLDKTNLGWYQPGWGMPYAIFDWAPGQQQNLKEQARTNTNMFNPPKFQSERVSLQRFSRLLQ